MFQRFFAKLLLWKKNCFSQTCSILTLSPFIYYLNLVSNRLDSSLANFTNTQCQTASDHGRTQKFWIVFDEQNEEKLDFYPTCLLCSKRFILTSERLKRPKYNLERANRVSSIEYWVSIDSYKLLFNVFESTYEQQLLHVQIGRLHQRTASSRSFSMNSFFVKRKRHKNVIVRLCEVLWMIQKITNCNCLTLEKTKNSDFYHFSASFRTAVSTLERSIQPHFAWVT